MMITRKWLLLCKTDLGIVCSDPISKFGTVAQKAEFLADFASGRKLVIVTRSERIQTNK